MKATLLSSHFLAVALVATSGASGQIRPFEAEAPARARSPLDELVFSRLSGLGIEPAAPCSDAVFLRRAFLDVIGTLPTLPEARQFLQDSDPDKRRVLIDALLERPEFVDYQALKWADLLRVKSEFPINLWPNGVQAYHRWIRTSLARNKPYDRFARELLTASGSNFRVPEVNFYRAVQGQTPETLAAAVALTFMGARLENWPEDRRAGLAAFFAAVGFKGTAEWKEEIVFFDAAKARESVKAVLPDGTEVVLPPDVDPRTVFVDWLIAPENPWFARSIVNRIWSWLLGRGIIHQADDIRPDNPPSNPELLQYLERELVDSGYDLKHVFRLILDSQTYQLSAMPGDDDPEGEANFAHYVIRRVEAEVLIDALCQITGSRESYSSQIPEPFTFIPDDQRSIALADGSITSPFLEMFGRPSRDTGLESERNNEPTTAQRLHLLNSSHVQRKIQNSRKLNALIRARRNQGQVAANLYLTILSRFPTKSELAVVRDYAQSGGVNPRQASQDLIWALLNSAEFLYRH